MRKSILIAGLWLMACAIGMAQSVLPADVVGTWNVVGGEIKTPPAPDKDGEKLVQEFKDHFFHSSFVFEPDHNFSFNVNFEDMDIKKAHWKYNADKQRYEVQAWVDKDKDQAYLVIIVIVREGDKIFISLPDMEDEGSEFLFKLEVVKADAVKN